MSLSSFFLVGMPPILRPVVLAAAQRAFPGVEPIDVPTVADAALHAPARGELLVLGTSEAGSVAAALGTVDSSWQSRWAVVVLGDGEATGADTVPAGECTPALLARVFRSARLRHALQRENLRLKGDLLTVARRLRHDLITPVGCIYTSAEILEMPACDATAGPTMIENIRESAREISQLIDRVSFVLGASASPRQSETLAMQGVVDSVLTQMGPEIAQAGATLAQPPAWPDVRGVRAWLPVVWSNLISNALRHGGPQARMELAWRRDGDRIRFSVSDHGAGVAPNIRPGMFRPLEQLHREAGHGLGLSIVQRLVSLQEGSCGYERHADGTSEFHFTLPGVPAE